MACKYLGHHAILGQLVRFFIYHGWIRDGNGSCQNGDLPLSNPIRGMFGSGFIRIGRVWILLT